LTEKQLDWLDELLLQPLDTVRVYEQALKFDDFYELRDPAGAEEYLRRWVTEAKASEAEPLVQFAEMLEAHWSGVIRWHQTRVSNGLLEGCCRTPWLVMAAPSGVAIGGGERRNELWGDRGRRRSVRVVGRSGKGCNEGWPGGSVSGCVARL
jgi:hypothetical protein